MYSPELIPFLRSPRIPCSLEEICAWQLGQSGHSKIDLSVSLICISVEVAFKPKTMSLLTLSPTSCQIVATWSEFIHMSFILTHKQDSYTLQIQDPDQTLTWREGCLQAVELRDFFVRACDRFKHTLRATLNFLQQPSTTSPLLHGIYTTLAELFQDEWFQSHRATSGVYGELACFNMSIALSMLQETQREDTHLTSYLHTWAEDFCGSPQDVHNLPQAIGFTAGLIKDADHFLNFDKRGGQFIPVSARSPLRSSDAFATVFYQRLLEACPNVLPELLHFVFFVLRETLLGTTHLSILLDKSTRWHLATTPKQPTWI